MFKNSAEPLAAALEWTIRRAGRKGRGVWADYGTNLVWHIEGEGHGAGEPQPRPGLL
jgi:hypothetical protein